jgi:hypothetical protein
MTELNAIVDQIMDRPCTHEALNDGKPEPGCPDCFEHVRYQLVATQRKLAEAQRLLADKNREIDRLHDAISYAEKEADSRL